ncbi:uncharacterized protein LOC130901257 [Diorhabda carinulata]|uniref:uncharacterized protein LOC130901257 n=1 Tax=Diorhabda carinulata TaxID=1163345 RepID=UPI0025A01D17|nr:uncharacterized protein LOC130901257 [Diorhabda carinulata]
MTCARCGCGVYRAEDQIIMTKVWHKCCFRCGNCNCLLNKYSARLFQGDIFCDRCYGMIIDDLESFSQPVHKTCRVVSSPNCICAKEDTGHLKNTVPAPTFNYCKKYDIHIPSDLKNISSKAIKSCSCLPDLNKDKSYCFAFPIPREVANYYNRINMRRRQGNPKHLYAEDRPETSPRRTEMGPCITIRTVSPSRKHRSSKYRGHCPENNQDYIARCCCKQTPENYCCCVNDTSRFPKQECTCCHIRGCSPNRRTTSPPRKSPPEHCPRCCSEYSKNFNRPPIHRRPSSDPDFTDNKIHICYTDCPKNRESNKCCKCRYHNQDYVDSYHHSDHSEDVNDRTALGPICACPIHDNSNREKSDKGMQNCVCGKLNPCNCKISRIRDECTSICIRCNRKVYAAEKICISSGPFHTSCFSCYCCHKLLDVKNVYEHKGEIYCKNCYNNFTGNQYYGYGVSQCF